jgi:hypothetical protein
MKVLGIALIAALSSCAPARAQGSAQCGPTEQVLTHLLEKYGEVAVGYGLANGVVTQLMVSKKGTWSAVVIRPDGMAWTFVEQPWPAEGEDG